MHMHAADGVRIWTSFYWWFTPETQAFLYLNANPAKQQRDKTNTMTDLQ